MQFFYAVPEDRQKSLEAQGSNGLPLTVNSKTVKVDHVGDVSSNYTVFYINNATAHGATTLTLKWG
jgi:hypothetical protein